MSSVRFIISLIAIAGGVVGCGHPATTRECEEIFERNAVLELREKDVTDPGELQRRVDQARDERGDEHLRACVGRRITHEAMECIRGAQSSAALDGCLR